MNKSLLAAAIFMGFVSYLAFCGWCLLNGHPHWVAYTLVPPLLLALGMMSRLIAEELYDALKMSKRP